MLGFHDSRPLRAIIGGRDAGVIRTKLGYTTVEELVGHLPRAWSHHGSGVDTVGARDGDMVTVVGTVRQVFTRVTARGIPVTTVIIGDGDADLEASFFRARWVETTLPVETKAMFSGKVKVYRGRRTLQHPKVLVFGAAGESAVDTRALRLIESREWIPIYPTRSGITSWRIMDAMDRVLQATSVVPELLDHEPGLDRTIRGLHFPDRDPSYYVESMKWYEAMALGTVMALRRGVNRERKAPACPRVAGGRQGRLLDALPFELTAGQRRVLGEISGDLGATIPMQRLLQGEVGSGKTVVALAAMLQTVDNGHQAALLAPTEVLVDQHLRSLTALLDRVGLKVRLVRLTGSMSTAQRREALLAIVSGDAEIVVGTHAIIQEAVEFFRLGLAVVDEQHRFGVEQRERLRLKGGDPHLLVMTATPIPRTVALTAFGDLDVSVLGEVPGGRRDVQTTIVPATLRPWVDRMWERIREEVAAGRQAFVVAPRIESAEEIFAWMRKSFGDFRVGLVHGRMPPAEKDAAMTDFAEGRTDILVATTVVEVGVDVPNATVMVVIEAEKFGVSQLHQLRGRVGRGDKPGLCLLHSATPDAPRLRAVAATDDGFELAERDLLQRREGDLVGTAQSGISTRLSYLDLVEDEPVIIAAREEATRLVAADRGAAELLAGELICGADTVDS